MRARDSRTVPPVNVGQVLRNAVVFNFSRHASPAEFMNAANIPAEVERLFDLLTEKGVEFLLVGGVAMLAHLQGRNTEDVDLIVSLADQERLQPPLLVEERDSFFARASFGHLQVDFLQAEHPLFAHIMREYSEARAFAFLRDQRALRCATPAGLMLLKLYALPSLYRQGQIQRANLYEGDIGQLLTAFPELKIDALLALLSRFGVSESDLMELRRVLAEQRPRPDRFAG